MDTLENIQKNMQALCMYRERNLCGVWLHVLLRARLPDVLAPKVGE